MESSNKSKVVDLAEERRRLNFDRVEEKRTEIAAVDEAMAHHPAVGNRQPVDIFLGDDEIAEMAAFIETNREEYVTLMKSIMDQTGGVILAIHTYEAIKEFKKTNKIQQAGRAVIEAILTDEDDASSDQLIYSSGQDS